MPVCFCRRSAVPIVVFERTTNAHNKEIAGALFVSVKTVEANLSRVYTKLGIRSRVQLTAGLAERAGHGSERLSRSTGSSVLDAAACGSSRSITLQNLTKADKTKGSE